MGFLTEQGKRDLVDAIKAVEAASSAEVVVSAQAHSDTYRSAPLGAGIGGIFAALVFLLFSPWSSTSIGSRSTPPSRVSSLGCSSPACPR